MVMVKVLFWAVVVGTVDRVVAANERGPGFDFSNRQF